MRTRTLPILAALLLGSCDTLSQAECCDTPDGPRLILEFDCGDPLPSSFCEDDDEIANPRIDDCQRFCTLANQACEADDDCFAACILEEVGPPEEAITCVDRATSCAGVQTCWTLFTGAPP